MKAWVVASVYGNDLEFACVCFNFPMFSKSVDVFDDFFCTEGAVIWIESVGDNLGNVIGASNVVCDGRCRWCKN